MLSKDPNITTLHVQQRSVLPKVVVAPLAPEQGSLALNTPDNSLYYADGVGWRRLLDSQVALAGDVTGPITSNTVVRLQNRPILATAPTANQFLVSNGISWAPTSLATITRVHEDFCQGAVSPALPPATVPNQFARFSNRVNIIQGTNARFGIFVSRDYVKTAFPGLTMCSLVFQMQVSDDAGGFGGYIKTVNDPTTYQSIGATILGMTDVAYPAPLATGLAPTIVSTTNTATPGDPTSTTGFVSINGVNVAIASGFLFVGVAGTISGWTGSFFWSV